MMSQMMRVILLLGIVTLVGAAGRRVVHLSQVVGAPDVDAAPSVRLAGSDGTVLQGSFLDGDGLRASTVADSSWLPTVSAAARQTAILRFAVIGDYGSGSSNEAAVADLVAGWAPDFVITTGDNNYPIGAAESIDANIGQFYSSFIGNYLGGYGSGSDSYRFWPSLGNHDWNSMSCSGATCDGPYLDYFTLPGNERYYDVDYGLVRIFAVNSDSHEPDGIQSDSLQGQWLQQRLASSDACFNLVYFHHAPYSSGTHGHEDSMQWPFAAWGADAVFSGHDHDYERLNVDGTPYFVNGAGGSSLRDFVFPDPLPEGVTSEVRYNAAYGAMLVTAADAGIQYQFINSEGAMIDDWLEPKSCSITRTPAVRATVIRSDLLLAWKDHADNCSYDVLESGQPYADFTSVASKLLKPTHQINQVLGQPDVHHFYQVLAHPCEGTNIRTSHTIGEVEFMLQAP